MTTVLWLLAPRGTGASTAGFPVMLGLVGRGLEVAYVDLRQVSWAGPGVDAADVRDGVVRALVGLHRGAGADVVVLVGPGTPDDVARVTAAVAPSAVTVVRLGADEATLADRLRRRARGEGVELPGEGLAHLDDEELASLARRSAAEGDALRAAGVGDVVVRTDGLDPSEVVSRVLTALEAWPA